MAVYFQFKSSTVRESMPIDGHFISVGELKQKILETKLVTRKRPSDSNIVCSNHDTQEDYRDDSTLIPRNSTVWVRRVPVLPAEPPIIASPQPVPVQEPQVEEIDPEDREWNELLDVINGKSDTAAAPEIDEDSRIKALVETPALVGYSGGGWNAPPPGYICHRCRVPGHLIQHCPTNGDPAYDIKRVRPPTGIPKSMLVANPDGSYALPGGEVAALRPNEAAFDREMEGVTSSSSRSSAGQLPPELHCRLCKQVMKDAVLTSRCCFDSFCDGCIRGHIISKRSCVCGATNVLADHLIPNVTLRNTISRILESTSSSSSASSQQQESVALPKALLVDEAVEQKPEAPKEMKTGLPPMPMPVAVNNNYMMPPMGYNPYWGGFMHPYAGYGYGYGYGPMMNQPAGDKQGTMNKVFNAKRKRDEDEDHGREVRSRISDRPSSQLPNKKLEHHHSDYSRRRDHHSRQSSSHYRSESTKTMSAAESRKARAYVPPKEAAFKEQKLSSSSRRTSEHKPASRKSAAPAPLAYEESDDEDDDRHFKRRPTWYKSSPPAPRLMSVV